MNAIASIICFEMNQLPGGVHQVKPDIHPAFQRLRQAGAEAIAQQIREETEDRKRREEQARRNAPPPPLEADAQWRQQMQGSAAGDHEHVRETERRTQMIVTDRSEDALDPDKIPLETIHKYKWINRVEYVDDDCAGLGKGSPSEIAAFLKACGAESEIEKVVDTLDPDSGVRPNLSQFMWASANPHEIDPEIDPNETAMSSIKASIHLATAKALMENGDHAKAAKHLDAAIQHFTPVHGAVFQRVAQPAETPLHSRSEAED